MTAVTPAPLLDFFLLDEVQGWHQAEAADVVHGRGGALELAPAADGRRAAAGLWESRPLDSAILGCVWHRLVLTVSTPAGTAVRVSTFTSSEKDPPGGVPDDLWTLAFVIEGEPEAATPIQEGLVQSRGGRFLRLRLELAGDTMDTPSVRAVRVHFPRKTWLELLPAVFSDDEARRWFLDRFLAIFHTPWSELQYQIDTFARYLDPSTVPAPFLDWLAAWLGQPLEGTWTPGENRRLLEATPGLLPERGTVGALRRFARIYLANLAGLAPAEVCPFPIVIEDFRLRRFLVLGAPGADRLGRRTLSAPQPRDRIQLDVWAPVGRARIVSTGNPESDLFELGAYRFTVVVPAAWVGTAADERLLRRALDEEKPAATAYRLCRVQARLTVGEQSTVGVDSIVGARSTPPTRFNPGRAHHDPR